MFLNLCFCILQAQSFNCILCWILFLISIAEVYGNLLVVVVDAVKWVSLCLQKDWGFGWFKAGFVLEP